MVKDNNVYLSHILDAIETIEDFCSGKNYEDFKGDKLLQDGLIRELEIIGEAAKHLSEEYKNRISDIPWKDIVGMRDRLIHYYFGVDLEAVWKTVNNDIQRLKTVIQENK
ncbi:MAG: DUF86 domain-containing protein [Patescibacteria group bacterium]